MMPTTGSALPDELEALEQGRAFVDRSGFHMVTVAGDDAAGWLNDLVTAGVAGLGAHEATRSLLLTPTGRIRADFQILRTGESQFLLVQDPEQAAGIGEILAPYVLSSRVEILPAEDHPSLFCLPGRDRVPGDGACYRPSMLGEGVDVLTPGARRDDARDALAEELTEVTEEAVEAWRVRLGVPRFGADLDEDSLPAEAGLETLIDLTKGCFLGQESVAKVRNLGHPTRVMLPLRAAGRVQAGEPVLTGGREVGRVTSAAPIERGTALIARLTWDARSADLVTASGRQLIRSD